MRITRPDEENSKGFAKVFSFLREHFLEGEIQPGDELILEREVAFWLCVSPFPYTHLTHLVADMIAVPKDRLRSRT